MITRISDTITNLNEANEHIQKNLVLFADLEKVKRYINEYGTNGDPIYIEPIESLFNSFETLDSITFEVSEEYQYNYKKLLKNIKKFREDFQIAKEQVPLNFTLRIELREDAQRLEDFISLLRESRHSQKSMLELILFRKAILEVEKATIRYLETDNVKYVVVATMQIREAESIIARLKKESDLFDESIYLNITKSLRVFKKLVHKTIEHYRTYSMLTKIVMPGDADEIYHYSKALRKITQQERKQIRSDIEYYIERNRDIYIFGSLFLTLFVLGSFILIVTVMVQPLRSLTEMFEKLAEGEDDIEIPKYKHKDEIGKLIYAADRYKQVNRRTKELLHQMQDYQENLEKRVQEEILIRREREKALIQQSKLASMGEMIGAIAHQWRQPLNEISIRIQKLKYAFAKDKIDEVYINEFIEKNKKTIDFMSNTIDDFRNFFRIDKEQALFSLRESILEVLNIQAAQLKNHNIEVTLEGEDFSFRGYKREFQQVIINIISNAKDAFVAKGMNDGKISMTLTDNTLFIQDNGGGISQDILERVFEPYFTTKQQGEGTGMGLYMSKMIIEDNMHSSLTLRNKDGGTLVSIKFQEAL